MKTKKVIIADGGCIGSFCCDYDGYAPEGCTAITVCFIGDNYDWWAKAESRYYRGKVIGSKVQWAGSLR